MTDKGLIMSHVEFSRNHLLHNLPESLANLLFEAGEVTSVPVGTVIINERETLDTLYVLLSGTVEVFLPESESRFSPVKLDEMGAGEVCGEYGFIDSQPASASIRAIEPVEMYGISFETLHKFLDRHHSVAAIVYKNLLAILVKRLRASNAELDLFNFPQ